MISKILIFFTFVFFILISWANSNPVLADSCPDGTWCSNYGNQWTTCTGSPGTQTSIGGFCWSGSFENSRGGQPCTLSQSCNTVKGPESCSCGAPDHTLVSCVAGAYCTGFLGDGCNYCQAPNETPTPAGPTPTGVQAATPTAPPPPPPQQNNIQCSFVVNGQRTNPNTYHEYQNGSNILMDVMQQRRNGGCWDHDTETAGIRLLAPGQGCGLNVGTVTPYSCYAAGFTGKCTDPTNQNCLFSDTDTGRDRECWINNPSATGNYTAAFPPTGTYCVTYYYGGHSDSGCNDAPAYAYCEFTIDPPLPPTGTLSCSPPNVVLKSNGTGDAVVSGTYQNLEPGHAAQLCVGSSSGPSAPIMDNEGGTNGVVGSRDGSNNVNFITAGFNTFYLHDAPDGNINSNSRCSGPVLASCAVNGITSPLTPTPTSVPLSATPVPVPNTCSIIRTTEGTMTFGLATQITSTLSVRYTGSPFATKLWLERKDGAQVPYVYSSEYNAFNPPPLPQITNGKYYYNVSTCPAGSGTCSVDIDPGEDLGNYYIWCDNLSPTFSTDSSIACSGNPNCTYKNNSSSAVNCGDRFYSCSATDNLAPISGHLLNNDSSAQSYAPINNDPTNYSQCNFRPSFIQTGTVHSADWNGYFLIDNIPVNRIFCLRPDPSSYLPPSASLPEYINNLNGINNNPLSYECQLGGGKYSGDCPPIATFDKYDVTPDNQYNFQVSNPTLSVNCGLNGNTFINGGVTWTANSPSGGSGNLNNYRFTWTSLTGNPQTIAPSNTPLAIWDTSYAALGPVSAQVTIKDISLPNLPAVTSPVCSGNITPPSGININGDVHSNQ